MYAVVFNGPPRSGKDTIAQMLVEHMDSRIVKPCIQDSLSMPLRHIAYAMTSQQGRLVDGFDYEQFKEISFPEFGGKRGRQLMIDVSESFLKPMYGQAVMAKMFLGRAHGFPGVVIIRDGGFQIEIDVLIKELGPRNVYVVQMHRTDCDFSNDSREWVHHPNSSCQMQLYNNGTLDDLRTEAGRVYGRLVNQMGWVL